MVTSLLNKQTQSEGCFSQKNGVIDRTRTGDNQNHNLGLYQLSYDHRWKGRTLAISLGPVKCRMVVHKFPSTPPKSLRMMPP